MRILPIFLIILFFCGAVLFSLMTWATLRGKEDQLNLIFGKPHLALMGFGDKTYEKDSLVG